MASPTEVLEQVPPHGKIYIPEGSYREMTEWALPTGRLASPVRRSYVHDKCGCVTTMGLALAETYARDPSFYSGTFCATCRAHFPVGAAGEFTWKGTAERVGT